MPNAEISSFSVPIVQNGTAVNVTYDFKDSVARSNTITVDQEFDATSQNPQSGVAIASVLGGSSKFDILYTGSFNSAGDTSFTSAHPYSDYDIIFILIVDSNSRNNILGAMLGGTNVPSFTQTVLDQTSSRQTKCTVTSGRAINEVMINKTGSIAAEYDVNIIGIKV